jgi:hypothetical protein
MSDDTVTRYVYLIELLYYKFRNEILAHLVYYKDLYKIYPTKTAYFYSIYMGVK